MNLRLSAVNNALLLQSVLLSCMIGDGSNAFQQILPSSSIASTTTTSTQQNINKKSPVTLYETNDSKDTEKELRKEIARRGTEVKDEGQYGVVDGTNFDVESTTATATATATNDIDLSSSLSEEELNNLQKKIMRIKKPRAYPLFLLEKAANIIDDTLGSKEDDGYEGDYYSTKASSEKEKIVVLGTGWGAASFLKGINTHKFDVTVVSPRNFFLFTPMLAGASVGTVEYRSITEPIREINRNAKYFEGTATEINPKEKTVLCESVICEGNSCEINDFTVEYDHLVITVGAQTNTFGIKGVREYCCFLKQVEDAQKIRTAIVNCFERANLPDTSEEQKEDILTFAVIGAGPTGIEFASELRDFIESDGPKYYPELLKYVRIKVIEASSSVLAPFDKSLQQAAIEQLTRSVAIQDYRVLDLLPERFRLTELLLDSGVSEIKENVILLNDGREVPYGLSVWAAGNGPLPITLQAIEALSETENEEGKSQTEAQAIARGRIAVDPWLRALGGKGNIYSFGDCSCSIEGQLPATAQVASQQGEFLARMLSQCDMEVKMKGDMVLPPLRRKSKASNNNKSKSTATLAEKVSAFAMNDGEYAAPFQFLNLGILAYTGGGSALAQLQVTPNESGRVKGRGKVGFGLWRSVYLTKQVSWRNRVLVATDWVKTQLFGRDITRL
eukprot:CAMPEP_0178965062 /NCGR_PEP_ID=MMETSP0789-20121207/16048_1 /TAXON_ID=3005 /ORGANISM="Rhizosolenia setigera, Strain CCMP 1694" /LENGTH=673 /DNA_ID=CAMNT_0020649955 /DNA_START=62 /DNA_END=2083 /DNA_ORIENTATION=+